MDIEEIRKQLQIAEDAIHAAQNELPPPNEDVIVVQPGDDIQSIIDNAPDNAIIEFIPNQRYVTGSLTVPHKPITLRAQGTLPARQIHPDDPLPVLESGGPFCTIDGTNAFGLVVQGLHFEGRDTGEGDVIILEYAENVTFDKIVIMGGPNGQKRGIRGNGKDINIRDSYIANCWKEGQDSQAFCAWNGAGPYTFDNTYFEAASENVMFGGADNDGESFIPSNITITNCTFSKKDEWRNVQGHSIKNLFELKMARFVTIINCLFEKNWTDAQAGFAIVLKSANQDGGNPWAVTEHVYFKDCIIRETEGGINIQGKDTAEQTTDINFENCRIIGSGIGIQIGGAGVISVVQCTFENGYTFMNLYGNKTEKLTLKNTLGNHNQYGVKGDGTAVGQPSLDAFITELDWENNVLLNPPEPHPYPPTTYFKMEDVPPGIIVGSTI